MHLNHEQLYIIIAFLSGSFAGTVFGFMLFAAWLVGLIFPVTVPDSLARNDTLEGNGKKARSKIADELPFAWSDRYDFTKDNIGQVTYKQKENSNAC